MGRYLLLLFFSCMLFSEEILVLKNGSHLKVKALPDFSDKIITFVTIDGKKMSLNRDFVDLKKTESLKNVKAEKVVPLKKEARKESEAKSNKKQLKIEDYVTEKPESDDKQKAEENDNGDPYKKAKERYEKEKSQREYDNFRYRKEKIKSQIDMIDKRISQYEKQIRDIEDSDTYTSKKPYRGKDMYYQQQNKKYKEKRVESIKQTIRRLENQKMDLRDKLRKIR